MVVKIQSIRLLYHLHNWNAIQFNLKMWNKRFRSFKFEFVYEAILFKSAVINCCTSLWNICVFAISLTSQSFIWVALTAVYTIQTSKLSPAFIINSSHFFDKNCVGKESLEVPFEQNKNWRFQQSHIGMRMTFSVIINHLL